MAGRSGALSIKPSEGSRSRVRWTRPMDFQSIFGWESLPEAGFGKNVVIDADRCSGSRIHLDHPNAGRSVVQDHSSDHRFKRLYLTRASVRRASGLVLTRLCLSVSGWSANRKLSINGPLTQRRRKQDGQKLVALMIRAHSVLAQRRINVFIGQFSFCVHTVVPRAASRDQHAAVNYASKT